MARAMPLPMQPLYFLGDDCLIDASRGRERSHAGHRRAKIAEIGAPFCFWSRREGQITLARLAVEGHFISLALGKTLQFEVEIGLNIFAPILEARECETPQVEPGIKVLAETAFGDSVSEIAICASDKLEFA